MKFEEVLPLMRLGAKVYIPDLNNTGSYFICCKQRIGMDSVTEIETIALLEKDGKEILEPTSWRIPRWAIMSDEWEIIE